MIKILLPKYEKFHSVKVTDEAITAAVKLSKRYVGDRFLPDKAIDLLDEASAEVRLDGSVSTAASKGAKEVHPEDIEKVVSRWTGIPITKLTEKESEKLLHMEDLIHKNFINHERAVKAVAEAIRRGRIGLANANRPIASFIFLGPTGTGKTELAKCLAEIMFGKKDAMIRIDMSEYMEKHEVAKLVGAPPGYVGYEEGGQLTEAVRNKPYSIVLLDEIEKAHPDVFNILLQLLEDGRLTDNKGNTISFKNTVIIATSNIGSDIIRRKIMEAQAGKKEGAADVSAQNPGQANGIQNNSEGQNAGMPASQDGQSTAQSGQVNPQQVQVGAPSVPTNVPIDPAPPLQQASAGQAPQQSQAPLQPGQLPTVADPKKEDAQEDPENPRTKAFKELSSIVMEELTKHFRPELINRFDEVVVFEPLTQENMIEICKLQIDATRKLLKEQNIGLDLSQKAFDQLAKEGYDPVYGARPLRRLIQRSIENPIAIYLIQKTIVPGETILVDYDANQDKFIFSKARMAQPDPEMGQSNRNGVVENEQNPPSATLNNSDGQIGGGSESQNGQMPPPAGGGQAQQISQGNVQPSANGQPPLQQASAGQANGAYPDWLNNVTESAQGGMTEPTTPPTTGTGGTQMQPS